MWKYRHTVKENPKSGYDWSATGQRQTAFCVRQREHRECRRPCVQSGRQSKNAPIESWDLMWNWHSLTDCTQIIYRYLQLNCVKQCRAQQMSETNRFTRLTRCKQLLKGVQFDFIWFRDEKCLQSNHHSTRKTIGFMHQLITGRDTLIPAVCHACRLWYPHCHVTSGYDWTDIWQPWGESESPVLLRCLAISADASSNQTCRKTLFIHKTICCLRQNW